MGEFVLRAADAFGLSRPHVIGPGIGWLGRDWPLALSTGGCERGPAGLTIAGLPPPHEEDHDGAAS